MQSGKHLKSTGSIRRRQPLDGQEERDVVFSVPPFLPFEFYTWASVT